MTSGVTRSEAVGLNSHLTGVVDAFVNEFGADRSRLMDIVQAVQGRFGYVGDDAIQAISMGLGMHAVEIEDMVSFYAFLDREARGRNRIRLSKTPISLTKGARGVARAFEEALGISGGQTSPDGKFTLEWTSDIGMADQEPAALVNGIILTALTAADVPAIVAALREAGIDGALPPFPPHAEQGAKLPKATVHRSLIQSGPLLSGPLVRGDGVKAAVALAPDKVIEEITSSKLRGRGGAGFPTGMKWRLTRKAIGHGALRPLQCRRRRARHIQGPECCCPNSRTSCLTV